MNKYAILHTPLSEYAYATDEHTICVRLRTAKGDVTVAKVFYGDRVDIVEPIRVTELNMTLCATDDMYDYYEATIHDKYTRVCYYFYLESTDECLYYHGRGLTEKNDIHRTEYFQFPYIRREDIIHVPEGADGLVMYQIFPDSFATGKGVMDISCRESDGSVSRLGGTLQGIIQNLDYIAGLGVNVLYLNPIFKSMSYHKYDTVDYFDIDPLLGTKDDFKELVDEAHKRDIRIILDGVFNHCGSSHPFFKDVLEKGRASEYFDWFYSLPDTIEYKDPPNYEAFAYVKEMPKLNTGNPLVEDYFCSVGEYWIREFGIDGWRLDVASEINHDFWRSFRKRVRKINPEAFLIAEIWEESRAWLLGDQFDSSMNYMFSYLSRDFFATDKITATEFDEGIQNMIMRYPAPVANVQMNLLDSHDVARFLSYCGGDRDRFKLALVYLFMSVGIPSIFYGDECYIEGIEEYDYRSPMKWEDESLAALISKLADIRKNHPAIMRGGYRRLVVNDSGLYAFERYLDNDKVVVAINKSRKEVEFSTVENHCIIPPMGYYII